MTTIPADLGPCQQRLPLSLLTDGWWLSDPPKASASAAILQFERQTPKFLTDGGIVKDLQV